MLDAPNQGFKLAGDRPIFRLAVRGYAGVDGCAGAALGHGRVPPLLDRTWLDEVCMLQKREQFNPSFTMPLAIGTTRSKAEMIC